MTLETHIAGSEDKLLDGLHFKGRNTASYVVRRELATFAPQQASNFKPSGVRLMRFNLADQQGWLVGDTLRLQMRLVNLTANALVPKTISPASIFRRMRIIANGSAIIEDVELFGRCTEMFSFLLPPDEIRNKVTEEWGSSLTNATMAAPAAGQQIPGNEARVLVVQLMSSFLSQGRYIPLNFIPVVIELELGETTDALGGTSPDWHIERPQLLADIAHLDQSLQNSYAKHLLDGKSLPIAYDGLYSLQAAIPTGSSLYALPIVRGFTRLKKVFISFNTAAGDPITNFACPLGGADNVASNDTFEWYFQVGSERFPNFNVTSLQESFYRLRQMQPGPLHLDTYRYGDDRFVTGLSLERVPNGQMHTGFNTRSGSQLTVNFKNTGAVVFVHLVMVYDQVANLSSAGVDVLD
jgi:hypothetical protein